MNTSTPTVIGLGYVSPPLVIEFVKKFRTIGFDISKHTVESCQQGKDSSFEFGDDEMKT